MNRITDETLKSIIRYNKCAEEKIKEQQEEIERLNNIINELEKGIKNLYTYGIKNNAEQRDYLLNKLEGLRELKGDSSNE